ncbi:hypothetical protein Poli38472_009185 [Pythium oligandrum]|uniref:SAM domain-containing protein n=1 Tax=Pythium oligandrum TaxID=41045 RepID=A0A8K1CMH1_PYTOL|nr:hypothetical protein Poli38472_009185 [Pythium oligandrum]|eukprot:TMW65018.1 hypothetical protein Poli38472_009185 [Pythium oligandrum]
MAKDGITATPKSTQPSGGPGTKATQKPKVSDRLEEDAQAMEERLLQLRRQMIEDKQRLDKQLPAKFGGNRWRSAQEGLGTVSRYAKDVEQRINQPNKPKKVSQDGSEQAKKPKKKRADPEATADAKPMAFSVASVSKWTTQQVLEWLSALGLAEFHSGFEFHQVTGRVLLEISVDELRGLGVSRLSARNLIWKELESIREKAHVSTNEAAAIVDPKLRDVPVVPELPSPQKEVHWSQLKPLRDQTVALGANSEVPVNLADGDFDEDASHALFMKALLDWRAGDDDAAESKDVMWMNPMTAAEEDNNGSAEGGGGALWDGEYDEEKEQEAFRRAVQAWRQVGRSPASSRPSTAGLSERIEQSSAPAERKSCWQCYRVMPVESLVEDSATHKSFCGPKCQTLFHQEYARLYQDKDGESR